MASFCAVAIAAFVQIILRISFFIEQRSDVYSTTPTLASWIFLIAFLDVLLDISIYPVRYMHLPHICQLVVETIITILIAEFGSLVVWCTIEKISCKLCKSLLLLVGVSPKFYYAWESYILGAFTTITSLAILLFVGQATDHFHFMRKRSLRMCHGINLKLINTWCKLNSLTAKNKFPIGEDLSVCESESFDNAEMFYQARRNCNKINRSRNRQSRSRSRNRR